MISTEAENTPLLKEYQDEFGNVDYVKLENDEWLDKQIDRIEKTNLEELNEEETLAFWLNAYNILTLKSVLIELRNNPNWKGVKSIYAKLKFFLFRRHKVAQRKMSLYSLENRVIRKEFDEPRIHFAINCASNSCPYLPDKLFSADNLETYLDQLTYDFINHQNGVVLKNEKLLVSRIFKWYSKDFKDEGGIKKFIKKYWKGEKFPLDIEIEFADYDWSVNKM